jgi:hypothetical protein
MNDLWHGLTQRFEDAALKLQKLASLMDQLLA